MSFIHAIILGIVEGLTEFLPISSTGHQILVSSLLHIGQTDFVKSFEIIIQVGAILAVVVLYSTDLWKWEIIKRLAVAFVPTGVIGLVLYKIVKNYLLGNNSIVLWSMFLGGITLILFERWYEKSQKEKLEQSLVEITYQQAFIIGLFQSIAIIPGVSRSAATIVGGLLLGIKRRTIVEFSFLLAVPTMIAASGLDLLHSYKTLESGSLSILLTGFVVAFLVAMAAVKYFIKYVQKHTFTPFGTYRILVAIIFWLFV
ncbi:MAG: undecaprenyl-diphosphate phosphatase [Candidatus Doudnabacteria bacterium]